MDRTLDEIISDRPHRGRPRPEPRRQAPAPAPPPRAPRREEYPRDGVRKNRHEERVQLDSFWEHDRYSDEEDAYERDRFHRRPANDHERRERPRRPEEPGAKLKVDNVHYELTEADLRELFQRIGPVLSVRLLYDRMDRSEGTAFVTYQDPRDARDAIAEFNGCNANGQPIRLTLLPTAPAAASAAAAAPSSKGTLFDRVERPSRSLFDRIQDGPSGGARDDSREDYGGAGRRRRNRSESPPRSSRAAAAAPEFIDRYIPGGGSSGGGGPRRSRSPMVKSRGAPRDAGRRPGQRREENGKGARRGRTDSEGRPMVGGRPRKTAEELDAEMADYWGKPGEEQAKGNGVAAQTAAVAAATASNGNQGAAAAIADDDIDMIE